MTWTANLRFNYFGEVAGAPGEVAEVLPRGGGAEKTTRSLKLRKRLPLPIRKRGRAALPYLRVAERLVA